MHVTGHGCSSQTCTVCLLWHILGLWGVQCDASQSWPCASCSLSKYALWLVSLTSGNSKKSPVLKQPSTFSDRKHWWSFAHIDTLDGPTSLEEILNNTKYLFLTHSIFEGVCFWLARVAPCELLHFSALEIMKWKFETQSQTPPVHSCLCYRCGNETLPCQLQRKALWVYSTKSWPH